MKKLLSVISATIMLSNTFGQPLPSYVATNGLLAWYSFSGNANDNSGNGHNGIVNGATLTADRFGNPSSAYSFNGSNTSISTNLQGPTSNAARTIACWFKYDSIQTVCDQQNVLVGYGASSSSCGQACKNFSLEVNVSNGPVEAWVDGVCIATYQTNDSLDSNWHFFAAVYDTSYGDFHDVKIYVDGEYKTTSGVQFNPSSAVNTDTLSRLLIGAGHYSCQRFFKGEIDDIGVWDRALDENELLVLYMGTPVAQSDSAAAYLTNQCTNIHFIISPVNYSGGLSVKTWFGDSQSQTDTFSAVSQLAAFDHTYNYSHNYLIKHVIYDGPVAIDSMTYNYNYQLCRTLPIRIFADANANCAFDVTEPFMYQPSTIEIDSAGIPIDTISATSGYSYYAYGAEGTIYTFKPVTLSPGLAATCPANGMITDTLSLGANPTKDMGLTCTGTPGHDLQLFVSSIVGSHHFHSMVIATNSYCTPTPSVLTMYLNPQYHNSLQFSPVPASISGDTVTWNINDLSSVIANQFTITADMEGAGVVGNVLTTNYMIDPVAGDANPVDNVIIHDDTITGSYDPNDIVVSPSGCLPAGVTNLTYTIHFENTGNDTAFNIYVLDTLSPDFDVSTFKILASSAVMNTCVALFRHLGWWVGFGVLPSANMIILY